MQRCSNIGGQLAVGQTCSMTSRFRPVVVSDSSYISHNSLLLPMNPQGSPMRAVSTSLLL